MESNRTVDENGNIRYKNINGEYHRTDGPAVLGYNGFKAWWVNGKRHREDGPARIFSDGEGWYYLNGIEYSKEEYEEEVAKFKLKKILDL